MPVVRAARATSQSKTVLLFTRAQSYLGLRNKMASMDDDSLKDLDEEFYKSLLFQEPRKETQPQPQGYSFTPLPGFVIKSKTDEDEKIFINICQADQLPEPKDIGEQDLLKLLDSPDASQFRVPMSMGEPRVEVDKKGQGG